MYQKVQEFFSKKKVEVSAIVIVLAVFFVASIVYGLNRSLSFDELEWTINFMDEGFFSILEQLSTGLYNLPLFYILGYPIYNLFPHNEIWLYLPNILLSIAGFVFLYLFAKDFKNNVFAICLLTVTVFNYSLLEYLVQFRPYALMLFLVCVFLFVWFKREKENSPKNNVFYAIVSILLMYTHWFGSLFIVAFGVLDLIKILKKIKPIKTIVPYIVMLTLFLPYFIMVVLKSRYSIDYYWTDTASIAFGIECVSVFLNCNIFSFVLFCVGAIFIVYFGYRYVFKKEEKENIGYLLFFILTIFLTFFVVQFYSLVINRNSSLCVFRYFLTLLPFINIVFLYGAKKVLDFIIVKKKEIVIVFTAVLFVVFSVPANMVCIDQLKTVSNGYKQLVEYVLSQEDIKKETTLVLATCGSTWVDYYFVDKSKELPQNIVSSHLDVYFDNYFTQSVKNGKRIEDKKVEDIYTWILSFDKIYFYSESYKELEKQKAFMDYVLESFDYKKTDIEYLSVFTKKGK